MLSRGWLVSIAVLALFIGISFLITWVPIWNTTSLNGPFLTWTNDPATTITIIWETPVACDSIVTYWNSSGSWTYVNSTPTKIHRITLTGLQPDTQYGYRINSTTLELSGFGGTFRTAPLTIRPFKFVVVGDNRASVLSNPQRVIVRRILDENPEFVVNVGDIVLSGGIISDWNNFFQAYAPLSKNVPIVIAEGNHEITGTALAPKDYGARFREYFNYSNDGFYVIRYANAYLIILNVTYDERPIPTEKLSWIESTLSAIPSNFWKIVFLHIPLFDSYGNVSTTVSAEDLERLFVEYNVDMVVQAHDHIYERRVVQNITYIITGGAGAEPDPIFIWNDDVDYGELVYHYLVFEVANSTLIGKAIRFDGTLMDEFIIKK